MSNEITLRGDKELIAKLKKLDRKHLSGALKTIGDTAVTKVKGYPPQPPTSYIRTFNLFDNWKVKPKAKDFAVEVSNTMPYSPYVQGDERQASFHRSAGWKRLAETTKANVGEFVSILKKQVDRILEHG